MESVRDAVESNEHVAGLKFGNRSSISRLDYATNKIREYESGTKRNLVPGTLLVRKRVRMESVRYAVESNEHVAGLKFGNRSSISRLDYATNKIRECESGTKPNLVPGTLLRCSLLLVPGTLLVRKRVRMESEWEAVESNEHVAVLKFGIRASISLLEYVASKIRECERSTKGAPTLFDQQLAIVFCEAIRQLLNSESLDQPSKRTKSVRPID